MVDSVHDSHARMGLFVAAAIALLTGGAFADDANGSRDAAQIDWAQGLVIAGGTSVADRHAPSPAVALGTSRRGAEDAARKRIAAAIKTLPHASGGTLARRLAAPAVQARVDAAVAAAITLTAEPETDGSWRVVLGVPLEAIRVALDEPRALPATGDRGPPVIVVEGAALRPALGATVNGAAAAIVWVKDVPAWAKDAPRAKARSAKAGAIDLASPGTEATLYVVVVKG